MLLEQAHVGVLARRLRLALTALAVLLAACSAPIPSTSGSNGAPTAFNGSINLGALVAPDRTVTIHAASKAFNLAALRYAVMHVGPEYLLATVKSAPDHLYGAANLFGAEAARAA